MNYIVFDLEATCWKDEISKKRFRSEIIEIGAVKLNEKLEIVSDFQIFIKPMLNNQLSDFCKELTTIEQREIDDASSFEVAIKQFIGWCSDYKGNDFWLGSWGKYDKNQLKKDLQLHNVNSNWVENHISIKHQYVDISGINYKDAGMAKVLRNLNIKLEGTHHRGIDDAKNIAKIFIEIFDKLKFERWS